MSTSTLSFFSLHEDFLKEWFHTPEGGREVAPTYGWEPNGKPLLTRRYITDPNIFIEYIATPEERITGKYQSVLIFNGQNKPVIIDKVYYDFDSLTNIESAYNDAIAFQLKLKTYYGAESLLCFSGMKGYAVYVWLRCPLRSDNIVDLKAYYTRIQNTLLLGSDYKTLDHNPLGDIKRVSRIPYTLHQKYGSLCTPIGGNREAINIPSIQFYRENGLSNQFIDFCIAKEKQSQQQKKEYKQQQEKKRQLFLKRHPNTVMNRKIRPCIESALKQQLTGTAGNSMRVGITSEYLNNNYNVEETTQCFSSQEDYNAGFTLEKVQDIKERGYKPLKCSTIQRLGFCLADCLRKHSMEASA
ncbi:hypothetical protein GX563_08485 [Candidatus Bathyarchaeota archaeon]|mgnify:CR=1 FL=1|nr:hypothetical protein [Candidatus Bathyarchaeota archaeon]